MIKKILVFFLETFSPPHNDKLTARWETPKEIKSIPRHFSFDEDDEYNLQEAMATGN